ncbi:MAG: HAD-IA family hydrolase [Burkholderiaceae bacterium]|jgi:phosphoglycolate phosphatase|nr:HAD-IA family hydrolase [Burkholderiaceae bacterium]
MTAPAAFAPNAQRFELICFDWDGTLFDSTAIIARSIQQAVVDVGGTPPTREQAAYVIGMPLGPALARAAPDVPRERYRDLAARYQAHYGAHQNDLSLFPGVLPLLRDLRARGCRLAVATGKSRRGLDEVLRSYPLQGLQVQDLFDGSRTADETAGKPDPLMLHELMEQFGAPPGRTLMIGDTTHDLQMAQNAGCASVGVSYGAHGDSGEFAAFAPLLVADSVAALHRWLTGHA